MDTVIEIKDSLAVSGQPDSEELEPTWENLQALYFSCFPGMQVEPALIELGHTLDLAEIAWIEKAPNFPTLLAKLYVEWIGLMSLVHKKQGIGQGVIDMELKKMLKEKRLNV